MAESQALKRLRFFTGQLLTADALELEQKYFREKLKRHNRTLHGFGIVSGLKVSVRGGQIIVEPGLALDCEGNELVLPIEQTLPIADEQDSQYVCVRHTEEETDAVPVLSEPETVSSDNVVQASTITEGVAVEIARENCNRAHRHLRARWLACGQSHALTIAKLKRTSQGWRVERRYRPPRIK